MKSSFLIRSEERETWQSVLNKFNDTKFLDVYYLPEYVCLYMKNNCIAEAFVFESGKYTFFIPYLKTLVNPKYTEYPQYYIETAYGYGGLLSNCLERDFLEEAWNRFYQYSLESNTIAGFIRYSPIANNFNWYSPSFVQKVYLREVVLLSLNKTEQEIWEGYSSSNRNKIKKAKKEGVRVIQENSKNFLDIFQKMYYQTMENVVANDFYFFPEEYFEKIRSDLQDNFTAFLALWQDKPVGSVLILHSDHLVNYHLSATDKKYKYLAAANLLRHEVILYSLRQSKTMINFGGGLTNNSDDNLLKFKSSFSQERGDYYIGKIMFDENTYQRVCEKWERCNQSLINKYGSYFLKFQYS